MTKRHGVQSYEALTGQDAPSTATAELPPPADPQPNGDPVHPAQPATLPGKRVRKAPLAPKDETKEQRFARLAPRRVARAIKAIRAVGNLSVKSNYRCSDAQREWAMAKIIKATEDMVNRFQGADAADDILSMPA